MKIFLAATSLHTSYGGPAYSVSRLADELSSLGHETVIWSADGSLSSLQLKCRAANGTLAHALADFGKPDVLHDNGLWLAHNHEMAAWTARNGIPRVVSTRGMLEPWARNHKWLKKKIAWMLYQKRDLDRAAGIHATSAAEAANIVRLGLQVPTVVPNGVDMPTISHDRKLSNAGSGHLRKAIFVGRIHPVKGLPMLIHAWARVNPANWELIVAGPDESGHRNKLEQAIQNHGLSSSISFVGPVQGTEKESLLGNADLFILPTHSESFGMAVAEALAYGLPVLTTTAAPWPIIEELKCGWVSAPSEDGIQKALGDATRLSDSELRSMGERGRAHIRQNFSWPTIARDFVKLYARIA